MQKSFMTASLIALAVITATALTTAKIRSSLRADRVSSTEQSLVREAAPFNRLVHNRADELRVELSRLASNFATGQAPGDRVPTSLESDDFDGMAWVEADSSAPEAARGEWTTKWTTKWSSQGSDIDASWLQALPLKNLHDGDAIFVRHGNGEAASEGLLITAESFAPGATVVEGQGHRIVLFGVLSPNAFAGLVDDWVGSSRIAQIFDENGVVLAHTNRRSVGAQLKDDGAVRAMTMAKRTSASGVFDDSEGRPLVAQAERIPQTNLRISLSVPQRLLDQTIASTVQSVFWFSLFGFSLLATLAYWLYLRLRTASASRRAPETPATIQVPEKAPARVARSGLAARISEAKGEALMTQATIPVLTFDDIETKAKANVKEILDRSAAIRARLNLDFVEDFTGLPAAADGPATGEDNLGALANEMAEKLAREKSITGPDSIDGKPPKAGFVRKPKIKDQTERSL